MKTTATDRRGNSDLAKEQRSSEYQEMNERVKRLTEEARKLSPEERIELLRALSMMIQEDGYDSDAAAVAECQHHWDDIGAESLGYLSG